MQLVSPRDIGTTRDLIDKDKKAKRPKIRRFNSKIFERPPIDDLKRNEFSLLPHHMPHLQKRELAKLLRTHGFRWALSNSILTIIAIICSYADNEMCYYEMISPLQSSALRALIIAISVVQIAIVIQYEQIKLKRKILQGLRHPKCKLYPASIVLEGWSFGILVCEIIHMCIVMPPNLDASYRVEYNQQSYEITSLNVTTFIIFLRVYHIFSFLYSQSSYHSQRAHFYKYPSHRKLHGTYEDSFFIVMAQMIEYPFTTLFVMGMTVAVLAGLFMHVAERSSIMDLTVYDGPWMVAITQLTVGYGDITPKTDIGRFIAIGPGILGVFTLSLVVTFAFRQLALSRSEKIMIETLYTLMHTRTKLNVLACVYIQRRWRLQRARRSKASDRLLSLLKFQEILRQFKAKFGRALKATPELEDEMRIFSNNVFRVIVEGKRRLQELKDHMKMGDILSTREVIITSRLLSFKRAYLRMILRPGQVLRPRIGQRRRSLHHRRNSSINNKRESDMAVRKLIEKLQNRAVSTTSHQELEEEVETIEEEVVISGVRVKSRRASLKSQTERQIERRTSNVF